MIKSILFDMDGTLADTETLHFKAAQQVLLDKGIKLDNLAFSEYVGISEEEIWKKAKSRLGIKDSFSEFEKARRKHYFNIIKGIKPITGLNVFLEELKSKNIEIALVTSSGREVVDATLSALKIKNYFNVIVSADDVKLKKPDSEPYLLAMNMLKRQKKECIAIEDSVHGIESAKKAGIKCIGITTYHKGLELSKADKIIGSYVGIDFDEINRI